MSIFQKNSGKDYNVRKKFQIGSVILMTQMTKQKNIKLIDGFDQVWIKIHNFRKTFEKWKPFFQKYPLKSYFVSYPNKLYIVGKRIYRRVRIIKNIGKIFWFRDFMSNFREIGGI